MSFVLDLNQFVRYLGSSAQFLAAHGLQKKSESCSLGFIYMFVARE